MVKRKMRSISQPKRKTFRVGRKLSKKEIDELIEKGLEEIARR